MKLKRPLQYGTWAFFIGEDDEIRVPYEGFARTRPALVSTVHQTLLKLAEQGRPEFLDRAKEEAALMKMDLNNFLHAAVEHQICVRSANKDICQSSGIGDKIHSFVAKIDDAVLGVQSEPEKETVVAKAYKAVAQSVTEKISGQAKPRLSSCRSCGGSRSFSGQRLNIGRAGRMR
jgi:hypothetical protein